MLHFSLLSYGLNIDVCSPIYKVLTSAMDTGVADTLVHLGQTGGIIVALWTKTREAVDTINACASVVTGIDGTVINVDVTHSACKTK